MLAQVPTHSSALSDAVDNLAAAPIDSLSDAALGSDIVDIRRQVDRLEGEFLRRLHRFDRSHGALAEGAVSTISWLRGTCGVTGTMAAQRVRMARVLAALPRAATSLSAGAASFTNISLIAGLADDVGTVAVQTVEEPLVTAAAVLDPGRMRYLTMATRLRLDADGTLAEGNRDHERRWFSCDQLGSVFILRGQLDAEGGAIVKTAIDGLCQVGGREDPRTGSQRRADALVDLAAARLQDGSLPTVHGQRPHLSLTVSLDALQRVPGAQPGELSRVGPVHAETARRIACDAACSVVAVATAGEPAPIGALPATVRPLGVGHTTRTIPAHIRTALMVRDRGCRFPGCDRPPEWTDGHHIDHWADLGPTEVPNLVSLCRRHHRFVHEKGWQVHMDDNGTAVITPPP